MPSVSYIQMMKNAVAKMSTPEPQKWVHKFKDGNEVTLVATWPDESEEPKFYCQWKQDADWKQIESEYNQFRNQCANDFVNAQTDERIDRFSEYIQRKHAQN